MSHRVSIAKSRTHKPHTKLVQRIHLEQSLDGKHQNPQRRCSCYHLAHILDSCSAINCSKRNVRCQTRAYKEEEVWL